MNDKFIPKINCRFKIRKDLDGFLGFFQGEGVLIFNEIGAFIVKQMNEKKICKKSGSWLKTLFQQLKIRWTRFCLLQNNCENRIFSN